MKLIKTILVGLIGLTMMFAQDQGQGNQQPPPEAQAYMQKYQETGDANEAFEAAAAVARANAEQGDDWDEQLFNDCKAEAKGAHDGVMDDVGDPQEAFKAAMQAACVCSGDCPPYNPSVMKSVHKYKKNDWAVDESKESNEEWMAAYDDYDNWKDWQPQGGDHGGQGGDHDGQGGDHDGQGGDHDGQGGDHDGQGGDHDGQGGQCGYEGCDFVGNTDDDWRGHCDANPEHCRPKAGDTCGYRHDGGDACGYVFTGNEGEEHFHCNACGAGMGSGQDMDQHCQDNPEHCRPQAGDTCGYRHDGGDACGYVFTGDEGEDHHHCDTCGAPMSSGQDMGQHCQENPDHCQGGGPGGPPFEAVDADGNGLISRDEARAMFGKDPEGNDNPNFDEEFDEIDTNGDGSVDPAEFEAGNKDDHDDNDDDENNN